MLDWIFIVIGLALGAGGSGGGTDAAGAAMSGDMEPVFEAEPQIPTGKFTTAAEVKPILGMTRGNWVALREYDGQDLLYVTHILSWRCGLLQLRYAVNGGAMQVWPLPPCLIDTAQPNAILAEDGLPFQAFDLGSVQSITIEVLYDDLTRESADFERKNVLMP